MYAKISQMIGDPAEVDPQMLDEVSPSQMVVGEPLAEGEDPDAGTACPTCGAKLELVPAEDDAAPEELPGELPELPAPEDGLPGDEVV